MKRWSATLSVVLALLIAVAGCSGVPTTSAPQVIKTLTPVGGVAAVQIQQPAATASPTDIVRAFVGANLDSDEVHQQARAYLASKSPSWPGSAAASIVQGLRYDGAGGDRVKVSGQIIGTLDPTGAYAPASSRFTRIFQMVDTKAGWRISGPQGGLILDNDNNRFANVYTQYQLFFFNSVENRLVPDVRWSATHSQSLANWLLTGLIGGPPANQVTPTVRRNEIPTDPDTAKAAKVTLTPAGGIVVVLPGIAKDDRPTRTKVAAQLAYTFAAASPALSGPVRLADSTGPVNDYPDGFESGDFPRYAPVAADVYQQLYYLRHGGVVDHAGRSISGPFGDGEYRMRSVAVSSSATGVHVAGVVNSADIVVSGPAQGPVVSAALNATAATRGGSPTRPEWAPGTDEVWVGMGSALKRVIGVRVYNVPYTLSPSVQLPSSTVKAVRFSPDGARVALVLQTAKAATATLWIGQVSRSLTAVQVVDLSPITDASHNVADVAWASSTQLRLINAPTDFSGDSIDALSVDGSSLITGASPPSTSSTNITCEYGAGLPTHTVVSVPGSAPNIYEDSPSGQFLPLSISGGSAPVYSN